MAAPRLDPAVLAHLEWLGYVQPTGLVVSAPALVRAGAILDRRDAEGQRLLRDCAEERAFDAKRGPVPYLRDFRVFARSVLGWSFSPKGYAGSDGGAGDALARGAAPGPLGRLHGRQDGPLRPRGGASPGAGPPPGPLRGPAGGVHAARLRRGRRAPRVRIVAGRYEATHPRQTERGARSTLPEHRAQLVAAVSGQRAQCYLKREQLLELGPAALEYLTEVVHRRPRTWVPEVDALHALLQQHGAEPLRQAFVRAVEQGAYGTEHVTHFLRELAAPAQGELPL